jgi:hypothetical protein
MQFDLIVKMQGNFGGLFNKKKKVFFEVGNAVIL